MISASFLFLFALTLPIILPFSRVLTDEPENVTNSSNIDAEDRRVYFMKKISGAGCPYTASWLVHVNLYRKTPWWIDITKMEAASFNIFDKAKMKFQLSDPDAYFVHHMSRFEHIIHKAEGFDVAQNRTLIMSQAAFHGECTNLTINPNRQYLALVAFYGGLPPNVTKDLTVKSLGQGNSLVNASTKGLQTMATICSCLKYFGKVVVGVVRSEDRHILLDLLNHTDITIQQSVNIVQFRTHKPAFLPFHMIAWGQSFVKHFNCQQFYDPSTITNHLAVASHHHHSTSHTAAASLKEKDTTVVEDMKGFHVGQVDMVRLEQAIQSDPEHAEDYQICYPNSFPKAHGGPIKVVYVQNASFFQYHNNTTTTATNNSNQSSSSAAVPLRYVYYTECDQIVQFDSWLTFQALSAALNESVLFTGRRKEKNGKSEAMEYLSGLNMWRECGTPGYSLTWPDSKFVQQDNI